MYRYMCLAMSSYPSEWDDMTGKVMTKVSLDYYSSEYKRIMDLFQASRPSYSQILQVSLFGDRLGLRSIRNTSDINLYCIYSKIIYTINGKMDAMRLTSNICTQIDCLCLTINGFQNNGLLVKKLFLK